MSSETFTTAMFLIAAIISAGVLINAVFPVVYTLAGTIASSSHGSSRPTQAKTTASPAYG